MKQSILILALGGLIMTSCGEKKSLTSDFKGLLNEADSLSYFMGVINAQNMEANKVKPFFDGTSFNKGLTDALLDNEAIVSSEMGRDLFMNNRDKFMNDTLKLVLDKIELNEFKSLTKFGDSVMYLFGNDAGQILNRFGFNRHFSELAFYKGMQDKLKGDSLVLSEEDGDKVARRVAENEKENVKAEKKEKFKEKIAEGEAFLNAKSNESDVITLPSGLRYKILTKGSGPIPTPQDVVIAHYKGSFIDGTVFQSSYESGKPITNPVTQFKKGWTEALLLMPVGSKWELYIPYDLAYGEDGNPDIEPFSTLVFEMELLGIKDLAEYQKEQMEQMQQQQQLQQLLQQQQQGN